MYESWPAYFSLIPIPDRELTAEEDAEEEYRAILEERHAN